MLLTLFVDLHLFALYKLVTTNSLVWLYNSRLYNICIYE